jgi:hypothetical protein
MGLRRARRKSLKRETSQVSTHGVNSTDPGPFKGGEGITSQPNTATAFGETSDYCIDQTLVLEEIILFSH